MRYLAIARTAQSDNRDAVADLADKMQMMCTTTRGWMILTDPALPVLQLAQDIILIGTVFDRATSMPFRQPVGLPDAPADPTLIARHLTGAIWGNYLAFWSGQQTAQSFCLRDPAGGLPAYYAVRFRQVYIASDLAVLHRAGVSGAEIDWTMLAQHFLLSQPAIARTCIAGVWELTAGAMLTSDTAGTAERQCWTPTRFAENAHEIGMAAASDHIRQTVLACIGALAKCWQQPLVELSGGLDSSIVAAAAMQSNASTTAVTLVTPGPDGDERRLADSVATHLGLSLRTRTRDVARIDLSKAIAPHLPRPGVRGFTQESDRLIGEVADACGADVLFNGGGGDSLFCKLDTPDPLLDRIRASAGAKALLRTASDTADAVQGTIWSLIRQIPARGRTHGPEQPSPGRRKLMPDPRADSLIDPSPLLDGLSRLPPGRRTHVADLLAIGGHRFGMARASKRPMVFPLMAQPIQEACLSLPSWLWVEHGRDRAIARQAFKALLPEEIAFRRSKGRLDVFGHQIFVQHRQMIRALLLDGALVAHGLLDRREVERQLDDEAPARTGAYFLLLELADIEAWVQGVRTRAWALS